VADGEGDGVEAEVVAEFVGEHSGEFAGGQLVDGEAGDDHEVATAGVGVQFVGVDDAVGEAVAAFADFGDEAVPDRGDARDFVGSWSPYTEHRGEHGGLDGGDEQGDAEGDPGSGDGPEGEVDGDADDGPGDGHGDQPEGHEHDEGREGGDRSALDSACACHGSRLRAWFGLLIG